jgi:hypothetical protein
MVKMMNSKQVLIRRGNYLRVTVYFIFSYLCALINN